VVETRATESASVTESLTGTAKNKPAAIESATVAASATAMPLPNTTASEGVTASFTVTVNPAAIPGKSVESGNRLDLG
jgi:hypothetical protein